MSNAQAPDQIEWQFTYRGKRWGNAVRLGASTTVNRKLLELMAVNMLETFDALAAKKTAKKAVGVES